MPPILTSHQTTNARVLNECVWPLFITRPVLDMTYDTGAFWKGFPHNKPDVSLDIRPLAGIQLQADCRNLPFKERTFATIVFDPPYGNGSTTPRKCGLARNYFMESLRTPKGIRRFYEAGIDEAQRLLVPKGCLIIKTQDMVNNGVQHWHHLHVMSHAMKVGFRCEDLFVFTQTGSPMMRHKHQIHARKNHSYFIVLRKKGR